MTENNEVLKFFDRPGAEVAADLAERWSVHGVKDTAGKAIINEGRGKLIGLQVGDAVKLYVPRLVEVYGHDLTMKRWRKSRGPEIAGLRQDEIIAYAGQYGLTLVFLKTQQAENIMISALVEADHQGKALTGEGNLLRASKIAPTLGMIGGQRGRISAVNHAGHRIFLLHKGERVISSEERAGLEAHLLEGIEVE